MSPTFERPRLTRWLPKYRIVIVVKFMMSIMTGIIIANMRLTFTRSP